MSWWAGAGAAVLVLATVWGPGALVLLLAGRRGLTVIALAPLLSFGGAGIGAVAAGVLGVPWHHGTAAVGLACALAAATVLRRVEPPPDVDARPDTVLPCRRGAVLAAAVLTGTALQVVPVLVGMGRPGRLLDAYDVVVHLTTVRHVQDTGVGSSLVLSDAGEPGRPPAFYPAGWHDLVALVPAWPDAFVVLDVAVVLVTALAWTTGLALLTRRVLPHRPRSAVWAAVLSAAGVALPLTLAGQEAGLIPNATALSLLPGVIAVVARRGRLDVTWALTSVAAGLGLALVHPNTALAALVVLLPWAVARMARWVRGRDVRARRALAVALPALVVGAVPVVGLVAASGPMRHVAAYPGDLPHPWGTTVVAVLSGKLGTAPGGGGFLVVVAAVVGGLLVRRLPHVRWFAVSAALVLAMFVGGRSGIPVLTDLDVPWYSETKRLAPVVAATAVPLAALALDVLGAWLVAAGHLRTSLTPRRAATAVACLLVTPGLVTGALDTAAAARADWGGAARAGGSDDTPTYASDDEVAMMHRLEGRLTEGSVLGSPHSGTAHLYALFGQPVTVRSPLSQVSVLVQDVERRLPQLGHDDRLCDDLASLGVRYLYVDPVTFRQERAELPLLATPPDDGVRVLDSGGTATVLEITACR